MTPDITLNLIIAIIGLITAITAWIKAHTVDKKVKEIKKNGTSNGVCSGPL